MKKHHILFTSLILIGLLQVSCKSRKTVLPPVKSQYIRLDTAASRPASPPEMTVYHITTLPPSVHPGLVDRHPLYPGCNPEAPAPKIKVCFREKIHRFFTKNFRMPETVKKQYAGETLKMYLIFWVDKTGKITVTEVQAPAPELKDELIRISSLLPRVEPAMAKGKPTDILFRMPIVTRVNDD